MDPAIKIDAKVTYPDAVDDPDRPSGTVIDHEAAEMTPPDDGVVLVRWSRSTLRWEYAGDLVAINAWLDEAETR